MDEGLHGLVYAVDGLVDGVLLQSVVALKAVEVGDEVVVDGCVHEVCEALACQLLEVAQLLLVARPHEGREVEVEGRDGLSAVHLVLCRLQ